MKMRLAPLWLSALLVAVLLGAPSAQAVDPPQTHTILVADVDARDPGTAGRLPLILIHGWHGTSTSEVDSIDGTTPGEKANFAKIMDLVYNGPLKDKYKIYRFHYAADVISVSDIAADLRLWVEQRISEGGLSDTSFVLVGHSMGGLISRAYMEEQTHTAGNYAGEKGGSRVVRLITLGTPHHGSVLMNGDARTADPLEWGIFTVGLDMILSGGLSLTDPNRSDLKWDNYNNLPGYDAPDEFNAWLAGLNAAYGFADRTIAYYAVTDGADYTWRLLYDYLDAKGALYTAQLLLSIGNLGYLPKLNSPASPVFFGPYPEDIPMDAPGMLFTFWSVFHRHMYDQPNDGLVAADSGRGEGLGFLRQELFTGMDHMDLLTDHPVHSAVLDVLAVDLSGAWDLYAASLATVSWDFGDGTTGDWYVAANPNLTVMQNVADPDWGSNVIELRANTTDTWFALAGAGGVDLENSGTVIRFSMKPGSFYYFYVEVDTPGGTRWIYYTPTDTDKLLQGDYVHHGLAYATTYGQWSTVIRDLAADLDEAEPGNTVTEVNRILVRSTGIRLDDMALLDAVPAGWDSDGDGLSDAQERGLYGTDPYDEDTDGDGASDGAEAAGWGGSWSLDLDGDGLNALLDDDSDGDGFGDLVEYLAGSNPADPASIPSVNETFEDGTVSGWYVHSGLGIISNVEDAERGGRVVQLRGSRTSTMYGLVRADGSPWEDRINTVISWSMNYAEMYYVYVDVDTALGHRYMYYTPHEADYLSLGEYVHHGLGAASRDGAWHTFNRDLAADLAEAEPGNTIMEVNRLLIRGSGRIDDVMLLNSLP